MAAIDEAAMQTFAFLKLPNELRNEVYRHVFAGPWDLLRRCESIQPHRAGRLIAIKNTSLTNHQSSHRNALLCMVWANSGLLLACHTTYNEGLTILYSQNRLHLPALTKGLMLNKRQLTSFSHLTNVSFDYSHRCSDPWGDYRSKSFRTGPAALHVDDTVSTCVNQLAQHSPALKTLDLHILTFSAFVHLSALAAQDECKTTSALALLVPRLSKLNITGMPAKQDATGVFCPKENREKPFWMTDYSEYALLNRVAPWVHWKLEHSSSPGHFSPWPGLRVNEEFLQHEVWTTERQIWILDCDERSHLRVNHDLIYLKANGPRLWSLTPPKVQK
ncbi:hypothetical protein ACLMJK_000728 [Lecanora helva]